MPKLPVLNADKIIRFLKRRGFVLDRTKGSHRFISIQRQKGES